MIKEQSDSVAKGENRMALVLPTVSDSHHNCSILLFMHILRFRFRNQKRAVNTQTSIYFRVQALLQQVWVGGK